MMMRCDLHSVDIDRRGCPWCQLEEATERVEKWKTWHDSASEDAVKWRKDAQKFFGALVAIRDFGKESPLSPTWPDAFSRLVQIASKALAD